MKTNKQARAAALFVMLSALSIMPGCGKSNDAGPVSSAPPSTVVVNVPAPSTSSGLTAACQNISGNSAITLTFYSDNANSTGNASSGIRGLFPAVSTGSNNGGFGSSVNRTNASGDTVNVYTSGSQTYVVVSLSSMTVGALTYGYTNKICGISIDASIVNPAVNGYGWSGTLGGGTIKLWNEYNYYATYRNGGLILL